MKDAQAGSLCRGLRGTAMGKAHGEESADRGYQGRRVREVSTADEPGVLLGGGDGPSAGGDGIDSLRRSQATRKRRAGEWLRYRERGFDVVRRVSHWR